MGGVNEACHQSITNVGDNGGSQDGYIAPHSGDYQDYGHTNGYGQQNWGFPRPNQGIKRVVELKEELERGLKKKKDVIGTGISNLSTQILTDSEMRVLDRGLKFVPLHNLSKF